MKIAILINTSWNIYNFRKGLIVQFLADGHQVVAIAPRDDYSERLKELGCEFVPVEISATGINPMKDYGFFKQLQSIFKVCQPDVLLTYTIKPNIYGTLAAGQFNLAVIANVSGLGTVFLWKGMKRRLAAELYGFALRRCSWIFFQNTEDRKDFSETVKIDAKKTGVVPGSGVNIAHFSVRKKPENALPVFLMVSRLLIDKGVREFADAAKMVNNDQKRAVFVLVGELDKSHSRSVREEELDQWVESEVLIYKSPMDDIREAFEKSDVVVLPSYREGTPRTLLEGGAMGKPLIATDVPGCNNVILDGENGLLCKPKDADDLAMKINQFLRFNEKEMDDMARRSREVVVDRFDEGKVIHEYLAKIREVTGLS